MDGGGGVSPRGKWVDGCDGNETFEGLETSATDYGDMDGVWGDELVQ